MGLIAFDLKQIITPLFHNGPGVLTLAVQGIAGDDLPIQCRQGCQQFGRRAQLTAFGAFLLVVNGQGLRGAILMLGQGEQANVVANILPSKASACGKVPARLWSQPLSRVAKASGSIRVST